MHILINNTYFELNDLKLFEFCGAQSSKCGEGILIKMIKHNYRIGEREIVVGHGLRVVE